MNLAVSALYASRPNCDHFQTYLYGPTAIQEQNTISILNNGAGVPVEIHKEEKIYVPELIFGHLLTSSNYDDAQKKAGPTFCSAAVGGSQNCHCQAFAPLSSGQVVCRLISLSCRLHGSARHECVRAAVTSKCSLRTMTFVLAVVSRSHGLQARCSN